MLLVTTKAGRELVVNACLDGWGAGVRPGMTLAQARALLRTVPWVAPAEPEKDAGGLIALAHLVSRRWSPTVSADRPDGILCDIGGCEHLFGDERRLVRSLARALGALGFTVRSAVASTVGAAWAIARFGQGQHASIPAGREREAIAPLPVASLRVDAAVIESLREVGVESVAQLLALPRASLPSRYGQDVLLRIDQALGRAFEPVIRAKEEDVFEAGMVLEGGTTHLESVELATRAALDDLCRQLERAESGLRRLVATFARHDAEDFEIVVQVSRPTRELRHLWTLLRPKVERLHLGYGVEGVTLHAGLVARVPHDQKVLHRPPSPAPMDDADFAAMLDTISNRIGMRRVNLGVVTEGHRPERSAGFVSIDTRERGQARRTQGKEELLVRPRPSRLLSEPVPAQVTALSPDGPVLQVRIRSGPALEGDRHRVITTSIGPERISGEWWRSREGARDYFRVQDEQGGWLWIFHDLPTGEWFIHGEWA